jgi:6-pyruvoyltetrahydropterin/6-carboxytetrahydropterin synthase
MLEIFKTFTFDAAHHLGGNVPAGHDYGRMHGHSFTVEVYLQGKADPHKGWILDLAELESLLETLRARLDHRTLNDIPGLETPTLERLCGWLWAEIAPIFPQLARIRVSRGTRGEGCTLTAG